MGFLMRVRMASFFAGATVTSACGLYILRDDYKAANQSISQQMDGLHEALDGRVLALENFKEVEAGTHAESTE